MGPATRSNDSNRVSWFLCGRDQGGDLAAGSSHDKDDTFVGRSRSSYRRTRDVELGRNTQRNTTYM